MEVAALEWDWHLWARPKQLPPPGDWLVWILRAGRGFGKSRSGAEWSHRRALEYPGRWEAWIAKTPADARDYMVEGPGGILRNTIPHYWAEHLGLPREQPLYEPSKRRLTWPNRSWATIFSSEDPGALRGFSGDTGWFDELLKYKNPQECWDNLQFGMREPSDDQPRIVITSTPRPHPLLEALEEDPDTVVVVGSSYENASNLHPTFIQRVLRKYEGTELGDQEIHARILDDFKGKVYSKFEKKEWPEGHVDPGVEDIGGEILIGQDFNVNPMASVIGIRVVDEFHVLDALEIDTSNTTEVTEEYQERYGNRHIVIFPDPSGKARKTSAPVGQTDFTILERAGFEVKAPKAAPPVKDRVNNTNLNFERGKVKIHPRASKLIKALVNLTYKEGTSIRDKGGGWDHVCDALDYLLWSEFNLVEELEEGAHSFRWKI